jgi:hypothetical protein
MDKQQAKHILKNTGYIGNEVGVAFEVATKSMDKLERIEKIVDSEVERGDCVLYCDLVRQIKKVLEKE